MKVTVIGGGYVGLPLAVLAAQHGHMVCIYDKDESRVSKISDGQSYIEDVSDASIQELLTGRLFATSSAGLALALPEVVIICVPTPLQYSLEPDLSFVTAAIDDIKTYTRAALVCLESTVYPGFTREALVPLLGSGYSVAFSPERVDPGNKKWNTKNTPKIIGANSAAERELAVAFYSSFIDTVVPVSSTDVAETVKLLENTFRWCNIGLVNELAMQCHTLGVDVWEVIEAASTKPFGFMPFYPGPGVGGHCLTTDPDYLSWRLRALKHEARFIELADGVNRSRPKYVVYRLMEELNALGICLKGTSVHVWGVAYKPNVSDTRESPALDILSELSERGAVLSYEDRYVPQLTLESELELSSTSDVAADVLLIVTDHEYYDYANCALGHRLVLDTRGVTRRRTPMSGNCPIIRL